MQLQLPYTGILYHVILLFQMDEKKKTRVETRGVFFLNFQYQLVSSLGDHQNPQSNQENIEKRNKCILCVCHRYKTKLECYLTVFSRC